MPEDTGDSPVSVKKRAPRTRTASSTPRARAPRKTTPKKTTGTTAPRTRRKAAAVAAESDSLVEEVVATEVEKPARKAPTTLAATAEKSRALRNTLLVMGVIVMLGVGASAAVGVTDPGTIDVRQTIQSRNERLAAGQETETDASASFEPVPVPVANTAEASLPPGGLRGLGTGGGVQPPRGATDRATTTVAVTDGTATSTATSSAEALATSTAASVDAATTTAAATDAEGTAETGDEAATEEPVTEVVEAESVPATAE